MLEKQSQICEYIKSSMITTCIADDIKLVPEFPVKGHVRALCVVNPDHRLVTQFCVVDVSV